MQSDILSSPYQVAASELVEELVVNRSRFICYLFPCEQTADAKAYIKKLQIEHPQASHYCYAFILGRPDDSQKYGFSDDGEPSGTAGKPMLLALQGSNVGHLCAVVVRYFGGTKLGTGGLQRAYGGSVRQALQLLPTKVKIPMVNKQLACQYSQVNDVQHLLESVGAEIIDQSYEADVNFIIALPEAQLTDISDRLTGAFSGQLSFRSI